MAATNLNAQPQRGGLDSSTAWCMASIAFIAGFVVFGVIYSIGVFLEPMAREFGASRSATSLYFSVASLAFYFLGPFTGAISDKLGPRIMIAVGAASIGAGLALIAAIDRLWLGYVTYGLGVGLGAPVSTSQQSPILAAGSTVTVMRRSAFAAAGTGCGGFALPSAVVPGSDTPFSFFPRSAQRAEIEPYDPPAVHALGWPASACPGI